MKVKMSDMIKMRVKQWADQNKDGIAIEFKDWLQKNAGKVFIVESHPVKPDYYSVNINGEIYALFKNRFQHPHHNLMEALKAGGSIKMKLVPGVYEGLKNVLVNAFPLPLPENFEYIYFEKESMTWDNDPDFFKQTPYPEWDPINDRWKEVVDVFGRDKNHVRKDDILDALKKETELRKEAQSISVRAENEITELMDSVEKTSLEKLKIQDKCNSLNKKNATLELDKRSMLMEIESLSAHIEDLENDAHKHRTDKVKLNQEIEELKKDILFLSRVARKSV